ncbi:MAG TPA: TlpA disulfide reductase family protein [Bryobacteraceae bacterium]|nr:TlpA disulfide reductase family protein [Bryobacteraceae bacterium]
MRFLAVLFLVCAGLVGQTVPRPAIDFPITLPGGSKISPTQKKGKVVIVEVLLTTCPHCQESARVFTKLLKEYGPKGLEVMGAAVNPDADIPGFVKTTGATFPIGTVPRESVFGFLEHSMMRPNMYFPVVVIIDRKGVVRGQFSGTDPFFKAEEANLRAMIDKLIAEGAQTPTKKAS